MLYSADVVVIGGGLSGVGAAVGAARSGAKTIVIERTGYLGGAIASYVRIGEPYPVLVPLTTCLLAWLGIYLRDERLRALLPLRRT